MFSMWHASCYNARMILRQLFDKESSTYTYLLADEGSGKALLIDPVRENIERDLTLVAELGVSLCWVLETHVHADHVTGASALRARTGARTAASAVGAPCVDRALTDRDVIELGALLVEARTTPGHTDDGVSYVVPGYVFTGDTLLIRSCGRTDFQNGNPAELYRSIMQVLFSLPDATIVFPGHDYRGHTSSTIGEERRRNSRIAGKTEAEFVALMNSLDLPRPVKLDMAVAANRACGEASSPDIYDRSALNVGGWRDSGAEAVRFALGSTRVVDVREPAEWTAELGHIAEAELIPLTQVAERAESWNKSETLILVCRSGNRSGKAAAALQLRGFTRLINMTGGMLGWQAAKLPVVGKTSL
jgi:sulfur dioxygenase